MGDTTWLTKQVFIVADNQEHETKGNPEFDMSQAIASLGPPAFRPVQMNLFARENLLAVARTGTPILHLGDALDLSCATEWDRFAAVMSEAKGPWLLAPGNHDGFVLGNQLPMPGQHEGAALPSPIGKIGLSREGWLLLCDQGRYYDDTRDLSFDKNRFIRTYLEGLGKRFEIETPSGLNGERTAPESSFLQSVAWSIDEAQPWKSFLVQEALLPPSNDAARRVTVLLVDTSNFEVQPAVAGANGSIGEGQVKVLRKWMDRLRDRGDVVLLAGHHHVEHWSSETKERVARLLTDYSTIEMILSAHTHKGHWKAVQVGSRGITELNVGSMIDSPAHYRDLLVGVRIGTTVIRSERHVLSEQMNCSTVTLPQGKAPHSIHSQLPPSPVVGLLMSRAIWRWKNREAKAELALLEDILRGFYPDTPSALAYSWDENRSSSLSTHAEILQEFETLQAPRRDPHRHRIRFLLALEEKLDSAPPPHGLSEYKRCQVIIGSQEWAAGTGRRTEDVLRDTALEICEMREDGGEDAHLCSGKRSQ
jgi:hypothetical protein